MDALSDLHETISHCLRVNDGFGRGVRDGRERIEEIERWALWEWNEVN